MLGGVVGLVVVPAAPEDAGPGAAEDACGVGVFVTAVGGAGVDVVCPGVPVAGAVGEDAEVAAQAFVAGPAEGCVAAFAGFFGDRGLPGVGGQGGGGGVAGAVVADFGEQAGGAEHGFGVFEERGEDRSVGVLVQGAADLAGELAQLLDDRCECGDEAQDGGAVGLCLELTEDGGRSVVETLQELFGGAPAGVAVAGEEAREAFGLRVRVSAWAG